MAVPGSRGSWQKQWTFGTITVLTPSPLALSLLLLTYCSWGSGQTMAMQPMLLAISRSSPLVLYMELHFCNAIGWAVLQKKVPLMQRPAHCQILCTPLCFQSWKGTAGLKFLHANRIQSSAYKNWVT